MSKFLIAVVLSVLMIGSASAGLIRLHGERISLVQNGTSNGQSISSHSFIKYYTDATACDNAKTAYAAETTLSVNGKQVSTLVKASCEEVNATINQ